MQLNRIGVVGAGVIGSSVAQDLAQTGHQVVLIDVADGILERARKQISTQVRFHHLVTDTPTRLDLAEVLGRIRFSTDYGLLSDLDFVVENVTESWEIKQNVYVRLDTVCRRECVFASNTSAIPITKIASLTNRAPQVVGMHFMNPAPLKPLVEVVRGRHTSDETLHLAKLLLAQMNKTAIVVGDSPGFVSNRVLMLTINEAVCLLHEDVASASDIDEIFKRCIGHKMGPLETADLIGLDTVLYTLEVLRESFGTEKCRPCPLLRSMVEAGFLGRKTGRGFYSYRSGRVDPPGSPDVRGDG